MHAERSRDTVILRFRSPGQKVLLQNRKWFFSFKNKLFNKLKAAQRVVEIDTKLVTTGSNELKFCKKLMLIEINHCKGSLYTIKA